MSNNSSEVVTTGDLSSTFADFGKGGMVIVPWEATMVKGSGFDSVSKTVFPTAAPNDGSELTSAPALGKTSQTVKTMVRRVETLEEMSEYLLVRAEANLTYSLFSASAVGQFVKESTMNAYSLYFLVECYVINSATQIKNFKVDEEKLQWTASKFRSSYGDYFVAGWIEGGYLVGLAEIKANSRQDLMEVNAQLSGGGSSGKVDFDAKFTSSWQKALSQTGVSESLSLLYAGMDDETLQLSMTPIGRTEPGRIASGEINHIVRPPKSKVANDATPDNGTDADSDDVDDDEALSPEESQKVMKDLQETLSKQKNIVQGRVISDEELEAELPQPRLEVAPIPDRDNAKLTMDGLLKLANALPAQAKRNGVPMYAILQPYSSLNKAPGSVGTVDQQALALRQERLSRIFLRAREVYNSVQVALDSLRAGSKQFAGDEASLKALERKMLDLMREVERVWGVMKTNPLTDLDSKLEEPDLSLIPRRLWGGTKTLFAPPLPLIPQVFVEQLQEAIAKAKKLTDPELRQASLDYLKFMQEKSAENYGQVANFLRIFHAEMTNIDTKPDKREAMLTGMTGLVSRAINNSQSAEALMRRRYATVSALAKGDQNVPFMSEINAIVWNGSETQYGFLGLWKSLKDQLDQLIQQVKLWSPQDKFNEIVDYRRQEWETLSATFSQAQTTLNTDVRQLLL